MIYYLYKNPNNHLTWFIFIKPKRNHLEMIYDPTNRYQKGFRWKLYDNFHKTFERKLKKHEIIKYVLEGKITC